LVFFFSILVPLLGYLMAALSDLALYHYPITRSARVLWLLHELGPDKTGPFEVKRVELLQGEGRAPW